MSAEQVKAAVAAYMRGHFPAAQWATVMIDLGDGRHETLTVCLASPSLPDVPQSPAEPASSS